MAQHTMTESGASSGTASSPARYYRPELDALRFFAFFAVFLFHRLDYVVTDSDRHPYLYLLQNAGSFGVPVFFLLSAFLITELLLRERASTGRVHVQAFYVRRILRIWPLYFAAFYGLALLNHVLPGVGPTAPLSWLAFTFFSGNWWVTLHGWIAGPVDPLWSISVEEQFYLVIPLIAAWRGRRALGAGSVLLLLVSYITVFLYGLHRSPGDHGEWTNSLVHFQFFSAGTLLALGLRGRLPRWPLPARLAGMAVGGLCWLVAISRCQVRSWNPQPNAMQSLLGWALVLAGTTLFFLSMLGLPQQLVPRWLAYLGRISYGLYVFHSLCFFLLFTTCGKLLDRLAQTLHLQAGARGVLGTVIVLALSIATAQLSYRYFETYFLHLKRRFTFVQARD